jgi:hypothetical protein
MAAAPGTATGLPGEGTLALIALSLIASRKGRHYCATRVIGHGMAGPESQP